jgi:ATP-dependent Clp protease protease subunit
MKKLLTAVLTGILLTVLSISIAWADEDDKKKDEKSLVIPCPKTKMVKDCLSCHVAPSFKVKEQNPHRLYDYPDFKTQIVQMGDEKVLYHFLTGIDADDIFNLLHYFQRHNELNRVVIEVYSPGGSMMGAWRIIGIMDTFKARGVTIETLVRGYAASAGFMVFTNGSKGYRRISPTALLMWHEVQTFKAFDVSSPSDKEEESRILRMFQDNANSWLASRSLLTKQKIDDLIKKKEFWMTGEQALEYGLADKLISGKQSLER